MVAVASYHAPAALESMFLSQTYLLWQGYYYCSFQLQYYDARPCELADYSESKCVRFPHTPKPIAQNTLSAAINWLNKLLTIVNLYMNFKVKINYYHT